MMGELQCCNCGGELNEVEEPRNKFHPEYRKITATCKSKCGVESITVIIKDDANGN